MNTNIQNINILSASKFIPGIVDVADKLAAIISYPCRTSIGTLAAQLKDLGGQPVPGDGQRSTVREDKYCYPTRAYGDLYCGDTIPANRLNRKTRRNLVRKVSANKPQEKVSA